MAGKAPIVKVGFPDPLLQYRVKIRYNNYMWFFRRKKGRQESRRAGPSCSFCQSTHTEVKARYNPDQPDYIRVWRGRRFMTCRCLDCGRDFYAEETAERPASTLMGEDEIVDDEEELRAAEEKLKRQVEDEGDRRCQ